MRVPPPPEREGKGLQEFLGHLRQGFESFRVWCQERLTQGSRRNAQLLSSGGRVGVVLKSQPGGFGLLQTPVFLGFLLCSFLCLEEEGEVVGNVCQFPCLWECVPGPAVRGDGGVEEISLCPPELTAALLCPSFVQSRVRLCQLGAGRDFPAHKWFLAALC